MTNGSNDWGITYSRIAFLNTLLTSHKNVLGVIREHDILFTVARETPSDKLKVLCCDEYCMGMAPILRGFEEFGRIDIFYVGGNWNGYSPEAKAYCVENQIGLYNASEMAGALWKGKYWDYYKKDEEGNKVYFYKSA